ncbi:MAG: DNA alkylation repair protein [Anaerolineae bacterium]
MTCEEVLQTLEQLRNPAALEGMARFGITTVHAYGIPIPELRVIAKRIGFNHGMALHLWDSGIHEARILASMMADPHMLTEEQMERWSSDLDSWDLCDQCCNNLFRKTAYAWRKAIEWSAREEEYVKRAGFALMASLAVGDKTSPDAHFLEFLPIIRREATDGRNMVKKAVNWALRQIGKRSQMLNDAAIQTALQLQQMDSRVARWIAANALRELCSMSVQRRLEMRVST